MIDILTNPNTLLCLGVIFLLISVLFFYFRRSISVLERAQMEQARILQSFITNMEMSQMAQQRHHVGGSYVNTENIDNNIINDSTLDGLTEQKLIDVSDENDSGDSVNESDDSDSDDSDSEDSDSEDSDSEDSDSEDSDSEENDIEECDNDMNNGGEIIDIILNSTSIPIDSSLDNSLEESAEIKVVQLQDGEHLDELNLGSFNIESLDNSSSDSDDEDEDEDEDEELDEDSNNNSVNNTSVSNNNQLPMAFEINKESDTTTGANLDPDFKSLNVQALRQIAEDRQLIVKGEKKTKKRITSLVRTAQFFE